VESSAEDLILDLQSHVTTGPGGDDRRLADVLQIFDELNESRPPHTAANMWRLAIDAARVTFEQWFRAECWSRHVRPTAQAELSAAVATVRAAMREPGEGWRSIE
jgi:hypothetical protein